MKDEMPLREEASHPPEHGCQVLVSEVEVLKVAEVDEASDVKLAVVGNVRIRPRVHLLTEMLEHVVRTDRDSCVPRRCPTHLQIMEGVAAQPVHRACLLRSGAHEVRVATFFRKQRLVQTRLLQA